METNIKKNLREVRHPFGNPVVPLVYIIIAGESMLDIAPLAPTLKSSIGMTDSSLEVSSPADMHPVS